MRALLSCLLVTILGLIWPGTVQADSGLHLTAPAAILIEACSGQVLYEQQSGQEREPASTTKIMTAILALELGTLDAPIKISKYAAATPGTTIYLTAGEKLKLRELIKGALISSGNDAATAIAEGLAGSETTFAWLMNRKAKQLGAFNTNFSNPHGLSEVGHFSSAYDLALMARYALRNPLFRCLVATEEEQIPAPGEGVRLLYNTNRLLGSYPGCDGIKTGTTDAAGQCLVASATRNRRQLISVVLGSRERYYDSRALLDYGFDNFYAEVVVAGEYISQLAVKNGEMNRVAVVPEKGIAFSAPKDEAPFLEKKVLMPKVVNAPIKKGQRLGEVIIQFKGREMDKTALLAAEEVAALSCWSNLLNLIIPVR